MTCLPKTAVLVSLAIATGNAHAALFSFVPLTIENDAVTAYTNSGEPYVASDGPLLDSFFTMASTSQTKQTLETQFAYLYNGTDLWLNGTLQAAPLATFSWLGQTGSFDTAGTGLKVISVSGDTATVDMGGLRMNWYDRSGIDLGTGAWSAGYSGGIGNLTCDAGSGCFWSAYTLKYTATIPYGDPSGLGGVKVYLELHGTTVAPIPEASTYGMMLAGLGLVSFMAGRRKV